MYLWILNTYHDCMQRNNMNKGSITDKSHKKDSEAYLGRTKTSCDVLKRLDVSKFSCTKNVRTFFFKLYILNKHKPPAERINSTLDPQSTEAPTFRNTSVDYWISYFKFRFDTQHNYVDVCVRAHTHTHRNHTHTHTLSLSFSQNNWNDTLAPYQSLYWLSSIEWQILYSHQLGAVAEG